MSGEQKNLDWLNNLPFDELKSLVDEAVKGLNVDRIEKEVQKRWPIIPVSGETLIKIVP